MDCLPHILFSFSVELFYLILCECHTMLFHFYWNYKPFISCITLKLCRLPYFLSLFLSGMANFSFCECSTNILCLHYLCVKVTHVRLHFICVLMSHRYPCVSITSKWAFHFVSICVITDLFSIFCWLPHFISEVKNPLVLLVFSFLTINKFITTFHISNVIIHIQGLDLFLLVSVIHLEEQFRG